MIHGSRWSMNGEQTTEFLDYQFYRAEHGRPDVSYKESCSEYFHV